MSQAGSDYPPLLMAGVHHLSLGELHKLCVQQFPLSRNRQRLFDALSAAVDRLAGIDGSFEIWIDGSFLTRKIDPDDIDFVVEGDPHRYKVQEDYRAVLDDLLEKPDAGTTGCDSFVMFAYPAGHSCWALGVAEKNGWLKKFGHSRDGEPKGIAAIRVGSHHERVD